MTNNELNIKVAIVDDHAILRFGLKKMLSEMPGVEVVIEACNGRDFIDQLQHARPQLVIIDINMPVMSGDEAVRIARQHNPDLKVIVLSMNNEEKYFKTMNELGVDGYIIKESDYEELERAITTVLKGGKYFSQELLLNMLKQKSENNLQIILTDRENDVLQCLCNGLSTNEAAEKLFISPRTIEKHRSDLFLKTGTTTSISLVAFAFRNGLVKA
jgi:DNA-binding NarL/FixJ family response regulator